MIRRLSGLGDKVLAGLVPKEAAKGGCVADGHWEYWCNTSGLPTKMYRRYWDNLACAYFCGLWQSEYDYC